MVVVGIAVILLGVALPSLGLYTTSKVNNQPSVPQTDVVNYNLPYDPFVAKLHYPRVIHLYKPYNFTRQSFLINTTVIDYSVKPPLPITPQMFTNGWILGAGGGICDCLDMTKPAIYIAGAIFLIIGSVLPSPGKSKNTNLLPFWEPETD